MIRAIAGDVSGGAAERVVQSSSPGWTARAERRLYYPYFWFHFRYTARTFLGRSGLRASCLVDARTRLGATTDAFELQTVEPDARDIVAAGIDETEARRIAERYTSYVMRRRRRALIAPEVEVLDRALVHKPFWVVRCTRDDASAFRGLVDGLTGRFHVLPSSPPPPLGNSQARCRPVGLSDVTERA